MQVNISFSKNEAEAITKMIVVIANVFGKVLKLPDDEILVSSTLNDFETVGKSFSSSASTSQDGSKNFSATVDEHVIELLVPVAETYAEVIEDLVIAGMAFFQVVKRSIKTYTASIQAFIDAVK